MKIGHGSPQPEKTNSQHYSKLRIVSPAPHLRAEGYHLCAMYRRDNILTALYSSQTRDQSQHEIKDSGSEAHRLRVLAKYFGAVMNEMTVVIGNWLTILATDRPHVMAYSSIGIPACNT